MNQFNNITSSGTLKLQKYREAIPADRYCIDATTDGRVVAVTCNQCKEGKLCINTCCLFGMNFINQDEYDDYYDVDGADCIDDDSRIELDFFSNEDEKLEWKEGEQYILVGPIKTKNCPIKTIPRDQEEIKLFSSGLLHVSDFDHVNLTYTPDSYCVFNRESQVAYRICYPEPQMPLIEDERENMIDYVFSIISNWSTAFMSFLF